MNHSGEQAKLEQEMTLLIEGCAQLAIPLTARQIEQFQRYYTELVAWNAKFNLTSVTDYGDVQTKHFLDSLLGLAIVAAELGETVPISRALHAIDVGSGAGFPGVVLKIAWPRLRLTLLDGTGKKVTFLNHLVTQLGLERVSVVQGRAEEVGRQPSFRGQFDLVVARAVAPLVTLVEYLLPFARLKGHVLAYKGPGVATEFMEARKAIQLLGGEVVRLAPVEVPFLNEGRTLVLIQKVLHTPATYPRGQGLPRRQPLV